MYNMHICVYIHILMRQHLCVELIYTYMYTYVYTCAYTHKLTHISALTQYNIHNLNYTNTNTKS